MKKTKVIVLFGGRSAEHEVSLLSARNVLAALDRERFEPVLVGIDRQGRWHDVVQPAKASLPRTGWLVKRATRADEGSTPRVLKTWIDAPFYARSKLATRLFGEDVEAVHESLSLARFRSPIVQSMLPYRMPRAFW